MRSYKVLNNQIFTKGEYKIVPIRFEDRFLIQKWRNEQMYHLRQEKILTTEDQEKYFTKVVAKLFEDESPRQLLFSYLKGDDCIGYGGLVHINWLDRNAEVSFIMKTELEQKYFDMHWGIYLELIEQVAFAELNLHKLHTFAFDLRPKIYEVLESANFQKEAILKDHCFFENKFIDVVIHSKIN